MGTLPSVGQVGDLVGQPLAQSNEHVATINQQLALTPPVQDQTTQQTETVGRMMRMERVLSQLRRTPHALDPSLF